MLRGSDKLLYLEFSSNRVELPLLLSFVRMGDFVANQLGAALKEAGLNLTQAMICAELALQKDASMSANTLGISLKELTCKLAAPRARLHAQLQELVVAGAVRTKAAKSGRGPWYALTAKGRRQYKVFSELAQEACGEVSWIFFHRGQKRLDAWVQMSELLTKHLSAGTDSP